MPNFDLVILNARVITAKDDFFTDIGIKDGKIAALEQNLTGHATIDAAHKLVIPGAVDPHVHLEMPAGPITSSDDWESGTIAAACGGTTTVIDFIEPQGDPSLIHAYESRRRLAEGKAAVDFGLHMTLENSDPGTLKQVAAVVDAGMPSFKLYTTYEGLQLDDHALLAAMEAVKAAGGMVMVHCENDAIIKYLQKSLLAAGHTAPRFHPLSRPAVAEAEAIQRVLSLAEIIGVRVYIVHVSSARGASEIIRAVDRGQAVSAETCPQYLLLSDAEYEKEGFEGAKFVCSPPLRKSGDQTFLWDALARGKLKTIGTDHCPFMYHGQKELGSADFTRIPGGIPGIETRLALLYTFGVGTGRLTLNQWVDLCCTAPALSFGIFPQKGTIMMGGDADLVIFDPLQEVILSKAGLHEHVDYTPYEGFKLKGYPQTTLLRGEVLVREGKFTGLKGQGRFLIGQPVHYE